MASPFMQYFHRELAQRGFLTVTFNFDYMDQGRKIPDPQPRLQERYRKVIDEVRAEFAPRHLLIGGKSMGGRVASYVAAASPDTAGLVFLGYPLHPPGKPEQMRDAHLYGITLPMLFVSGTRDAVADRDRMGPVLERLGVRATMVWVEGGDHSLKVSKRAGDSLSFAADSIAAWIREKILGERR
jgi:predicted alpha/beta-hydrolase family hydrolase